MSTKASRSITNLVKKGNGAFTYSPGGSKITHTAPSGHPTNVAMEKAVAIAAQRRKDAEKESLLKRIESDKAEVARIESEEAAAKAAKEAERAQAEAQANAPKSWWGRLVTFLDELLLGPRESSKAVAKMVAVAPPAPAKPISKPTVAAKLKSPLAANLSSLGVDYKLAAPDRDSSPALRTQDKEGAALPVPLPASPTPHSVEVPAAVSSNSGNPDAKDQDKLIASSIIESENGIKITYPDGFIVEIPAGDPDLKTFSEALDQVEIQNQHVDVLKKQIKKEMGGDGTLRQGQILRIPDAPAGTPRFALLLADNSWQALNLSPEEITTLVEMDNQQLLGTGKISVAPKSLKISLISLAKDGKEQSWTELMNVRESAKAKKQVASVDAPKNATPSGKLDLDNHDILKKANEEAQLSTQATDSVEPSQEDLAAAHPAAEQGPEVKYKATSKETKQAEKPQSPDQESEMGKLSNTLVSIATKNGDLDKVKVGLDSAMELFPTNPSAAMDSVRRMIQTQLRIDQETPAVAPQSPASPEAAAHDTTSAKSSPKGVDLKPNTALVVYDGQVYLLGKTHGYHVALGDEAAKNVSIAPDYYIGAHVEESSNGPRVKSIFCHGSLADETTVKSPGAVFGQHQLSGVDAEAFSKLQKTLEERPLVSAPAPNTDTAFPEYEKPEPTVNL